MDPGGRRPSHPWDQNQITPNPGSHVRPGHLPPNLIALPQSCEGPSVCNEATGLGLRCEGTPPQCNGGLFTRGVPCPGNPGNWAPFGLPSLRGKDQLQIGVTCRECGDALNLQYSFLIKLASLYSFFFFVYGCEEKNRTKKP